MTDSALDATTIQGNYWEKPTDFAFRNCAIKTRDELPFLKLGVYTIGKIGFDGCAVSGKGSLVDVGDLRPIRFPANADPSTNPDLRPGEIALHGTKWKSEAKTVVTHAIGRKDALSPKRITIVDNASTWPEGVNVATDLPDGWKLSASD